MPRVLQISSTKTYTHAHGLSCCFRQWNADSHCHFLHGYALQISIEFSVRTKDRLDKNGWVFDFGSMKPFKAWLEETFDHRLLIAADDPRRTELEHLSAIGVADVLVLERAGIEAFAFLVYDKAVAWLDTQVNAVNRKVYVSRVKINEHETNGVVIYADDEGNNVVNLKAVP